MAVIGNRCSSKTNCIRFNNNLLKQGVTIRTTGCGLILLGVVLMLQQASGCDIRAEIDVLRDYDLPTQPTQGPVCGSNSCCGIAENKLKALSHDDVEKFYKESVMQVASLFETRSKKLEELFKEMMARSKKELHLMFERTYGIIYLQNSVVFTDFFAELEKYYAHGGVSLTETMDHFFTILYQRMFKVINSQYQFNDDYFTCVAKDIAKLKPFGDIPTKLAILLRRSFVATRIFHKALARGGLVAEKMLKLNLSEDCGLEVARMQYCGTCTGQTGAGTCNNYCSDTLKGCFGALMEFNENWDSFIDGLDKVADKLLGAFNIEMVVEPINVKISEAIMNFQETGTEVSQKVFVECGAPKLIGDLKRRRRSAAASPAATTANNNNNNKEVKFKPLHFNKGKKKHKKTNEYDRQSQMEKRITEVKQKIKETRNFWSHLPYQYCNNISTAPPSENGFCWNGTALSYYKAPSTTASSSNKNNNAKPTVILEQIYTLQVLMSKLQSAYQGQDDELSDDDDDEMVASSGSGSGAGSDVDAEDANGGSVDGDDVDFDVDITDTTTTSTTTVKTTERVVIRKYDGPRVVAGSASELTKALAHYILPIVMVWFGGAVTELL